MLRDVKPLLQIFGYRYAEPDRDSPCFSTLSSLSQNSGATHTAAQLQDFLKADHEALQHTSADVESQMVMDWANQDVYGSVTGHLLRRAYCFRGDQRFERVSQLAVDRLRLRLSLDGTTVAPAKCEKLTINFAVSSRLLWVQ